MPFPAGTANLLALNLAAPNEPHALAKMLRAGITLDFDMAEIEFHADDGESAKKGFGIMAGAGYDATIMKGAQPSKRLLGPMAYFSAALANPLPPTSKITLTLDGETVEEEGLGILIVNFSKIQFDISVTNKNSPRDGLLDIVVLKAENAFGLLPALFARAIDHEGNFKDSPETIETFQAREVIVEADHRCRFNTTARSQRRRRPSQHVSSPAPRASSCRKSASSCSAPRATRNLPPGPTGRLRRKRRRANWKPPPYAKPSGWLSARAALRTRNQLRAA